MTHCEYCFADIDKGLKFTQKNIRKGIGIELYLCDELVFTFCGKRVNDAKKELKELTI